MALQGTSLRPVLGHRTGARGPDPLEADDVSMAELGWAVAEQHSRSSSIGRLLEGDVIYCSTWRKWTRLLGAVCDECQRIALGFLDGCGRRTGGDP